MMNVFRRDKIRLLLGRSAEASKAEKIFLELFRGELSAEEIKTLLLLLTKKGEGAPEIWGCVRALAQLDPPRRVGLPLMDVCGTGGDGRGTFNISTVSSFVIAGAGGYVAKHGNRSVSSRVGSSDLMEALGVRTNLPFQRMLKALHKCRLGYFHAPLYHPSFSHVQGVRRELGIRTLFNLIGPLLNPLDLRYQMIGISNSDWLQPIAEILRRLGRVRAAVVRSVSGMDELSTQEINDILLIEGTKMKKLRLDPKKLGFTGKGQDDYRGGDLQGNREIALGILENRLRGPRQGVVLLNSGFALWLAGLSPSIKEGIERSRWSLRTGRARDVLEALRRISRKRSKQI